MIFKIKKFYFYLLALIFSFFSFSPALAAGLVPCGNEGNPCGFCDLFKLGQNIINFLMYKISPPLVVIFITYGGIMMMLNSGNPGKLDESKKIISSAIIGLIIMLCSWVILNTFFELMTGGGWPWDIITC